MLTGQLVNFSTCPKNILPPALIMRQAFEDERRPLLMHLQAGQKK
jgi:hypothetical protein